MTLFTLKRKEVKFARTDQEFAQLTYDVLKEIRTFIKENDLQLTEDSETSLSTLERIHRYVKYGYKNRFQNKSYNRKKKFNKYVRTFRKKQSIASANKVLWFLRNRILSYESEITATSRWGGIYTKREVIMPDFPAVKILPPKKHVAIQEKRKAWKEAQAIADKLLMEYKEEKKGYYKEGRVL
jgi:hypothetical protein